MPINFRKFQNLTADTLSKYDFTDNGDGTMTLIPNYGTIVNGSTPLSETVMNDLTKNSTFAGNGVLNSVGQEAYEVAVIGLLDPINYGVGSQNKDIPALGLYDNLKIRLKITEDNINNGTKIRLQDAITTIDKGLKRLDDGNYFDVVPGTIEIGFIDIVYDLPNDFFVLTSWSQTVTAESIGALPLTGGTMTGPLNFSGISDLIKYETGKVLEVGVNTILSSPVGGSAFFRIGGTTMDARLYPDGDFKVHGDVVAYIGS
jgi:hypothetical protein